MKSAKLKKEKKKPEAAKKKKAAVKKTKAAQTIRSKPEKKLRVLILEDNPADAELMERQLKKSGFAFVSQRVENKGEFLKALKAFKPDLILADYSLPKFNALHALELQKIHAPLIPFIVVTGSVSEEVAVECMKQGTDDYLLKDRLARLGEAVRHAMTGRRLQAEKVAAEETLRESEENFVDIFQTVREGIAYTTLLGKVISINSALEQILDMPKKDIVGKNILALTKGLLAQENAKKVIPMLEKLVRGNRIDNFQIKYKEKVLEISSSINRKTQRLTGVIRDITERKHYEEALLAAATRWRTTFDSMNDAVCLLDETGAVRQCNRAMNRLLGLSYKTIIGRDCLSLVCGPRRKSVCGFRRLMKDHKRHEEEIVWRQRWFKVAVDPIIAAGGRILGAVHIMTDITDAKKAKEALRESEERFRGLYENANIGMYRTTPDGRILMANPALVRMLGYGSFAELAKRNLQKEGFEPDYPRRDFRRQVERVGNVIGLEASWHKKDGTSIFVRESARVVKDAKGTIVFYDGTVEDISDRKRTQEQIEDAARKWATTFDAIKDGIALLAADQTVLQANKAFAALLGVPFQKIIGKKCYELMHDDRRPHPQCPFRRMLKSKKRESMELVIAGRTFEIIVDPISNEAGKITSAAHIISDITERKQAEVALHESENKFKQVFEAANVGKSITLPTSEIFVNQTFCDMLGYKREELQQTRWQAITPPDEIGTIQKILEPLLKGKSDSARFNKRYIHKNGSHVWADVSTALHRDNAGKPLYFITTIIDISERMQAEQKLAESEQKFRTLYENAPIAHQSLDSEGNIMDVNPAWLKVLGYRKKEIIGNYFGSFLHPDWKEHFEKNFPEFKRLGYVHDVQFKIKHKDGHYLDISFEGCIGHHPDGSFKQTYCVFQDISERKRAEEQICASLLEKEVLLKEIHHRVKNNLQVISGLLTLQAQQIDDERLQRVIKDSQHRIWTMALIHQTLYQSGSLAAIDMADYIRSLAGNLLSSQARVAMPPNIVFDLQPLRLAIDKAIPLALIVNELLTNALKHAFADGRPGEIRISLRGCSDRSRPVTTDNMGEKSNKNKSRPVPTDNMDTARRAPTYELTVADNGVGLPAGFDAKNQKSLGLQLVTMLTKQLDGSLAIESRDGTTMRVSFETNEKSKKQA